MNEALSKNVKYVNWNKKLILSNLFLDSSYWLTAFYEKKILVNILSIVFLDTVDKAFNLLLCL